MGLSKYSSSGTYTCEPDGFLSLHYQAIHDAVDDWEVDIIVLSLGFGKENGVINKSIRYAASKDVLMFAAASNDGRNRPDGIAWPARRSDVLCVHSGNGDGSRSSFTPDAEDHKRIMVLGEGVESAWPLHLGCKKGHKIMNGTSCAAPIAAGIAALVLDYARGFLTSDEWIKLRRTDSMREAFSRMKNHKSHGEHWWIRHWTLFHPDRSEGWIQDEIRSAIL